MMRLFMLGMLLFAGTAEAANMANPDDTYTDLLTLVRDGANQWSAVLREYATWLFWSLATIQLVLTIGPMVARQSSGPDIFVEFLLWLMKTIFFYSVLVNSVVWGQAVIDSFRIAGGRAAGTNYMLEPGHMFELAVKFADTVSSVSTLNPVEGIGIVFSSLIVLASFTYIAALMGVALLESYFVVNASVLFLGFGGAQFTREYASALIKYCIAVAAELFVLTLIVGLITHAAKDWQASYQHNNTSTLVLVGLSLMLCVFTHKLINVVQSLILGVSSGGSGSVLGGMAMAGMAFGAAASSAISAKLASSGILGGGGGGGIANAISSSLSGGGASGGGSSSGFSGGGGSSPPPPPSPPSGSGGSGGAPSAAPSAGMFTKAAGATHAATAAAAKTTAFISELAVPGMSGATGHSMGPSPVAPEFGGGGFASEPSSPPDTPANIIRPEEIEKQPDNSRGK